MATAARHQLISLSKPGCWQAALADLPADSSCQITYAAALQHSCSAPIFLYHYQSTSAALAVPLLLRGSNTLDITTPYGVRLSSSVGSDPGFAAAFSAFATAQRWTSGYIVTASEFSCAEWGLQPMVGSKTVCWDIADGAPNLLTRMSKTSAHELQRWLQRGVVIDTERQAILAWLLDYYPSFLKRIGAAPVYHFAPETLRLLVQSPTCLPLAAVVDGTIEAVSLFLFAGNRAEYFLNVSTESGRDHSRGLLWRAAAILAEHGVRYLELGGGARGEDGLFAFKRRLGGQTTSQGLLKLVFDSEKYLDACTRCGCEPGASGYFPPYLNPKQE